MNKCACQDAQYNYNKYQPAISDINLSSKTNKKQIKSLSNVQENMKARDFPGDPEAKAPCFQCRGPGCDPQIRGTISHMPQLKISCAVRPGTGK